MPLEFFPGDASFNLANAIYLAHAADIAYHRAPAEAARERLGLEVVPFLNRLTRTRGFLGVCDTHAVLSFRGSDPVTLQTWLTDVVAKLVVRADYHGKVHLGFSSALKRTWGKFDKHLQSAQDKPLFLTGHSMGGALAVLTACRLAKDGRAPKATYTFGSPRVGDHAFCKKYDLPTYRIVNRLDLVPEMPLSRLDKMLPDKPRITNEKILRKLKIMARRVPCYGHIDTFVYIDRDGQVIVDADVEPWHKHAVARAVATRGKSFLEGITDHLISNYIKGLQGVPSKKQTGNRRKV